MNTSHLPDRFFHPIGENGGYRFMELPTSEGHNAAWDLALARSGNVYIPMCGEASKSVEVELFQYDAESDELSSCFKMGDAFYREPNTIPHSKIHTSLAEMEDGTLLMATHTTAASKGRPAWLFEQNYLDLNEGFPGSHVLHYNPQNGSVRSLGIPFPRDSIYGAVYDAATHAYWFTTFLRGHLCRWSLDSGELVNLGQFAEVGSYCLFSDDRRNLYASSRSGHLFRVQMDSLKVEHLGKMEGDDHPDTRVHRMVAKKTRHPDGRIFMVVHFCNRLTILDPKSGQISYSRSLIPSCCPTFQKTKINMAHWDSDGVLWYAMTFPYNEGGVGCTLQLFRWSGSDASEPDYLGMIGSEARASASCGSSAYCAKTDRIYLADTNHGEIPPGLGILDLAKLREGRHPVARKKTVDANAYLLFDEAADLYPGSHYEEAVHESRETLKFLHSAQAFIHESANPYVQAGSIDALRVWEQVPFGEGAVLAMDFDSEAEKVICWTGHWKGGIAKWRIEIRDGLVLNIERAEREIPRFSQKPSDRVQSVARAGRRYCAEVTAELRLESGGLLRGTEDGCVFLVSPDGVMCSYGSLSGGVSIRMLTGGRSSTNEFVVFGVASGPNDLGLLFVWSVERGLLELGRVCAPGSALDPQQCFSTQPSCLLFDPASQRLLVGCSDQLGTVYSLHGVLV